VHAEPVAALLREYGLDAEARRGMEWDELRTEVAAGRPVIVWVIGQVWQGTPVRYKASDGSKTTVARFEHTMIIVGYDATSVQLVDAYTGDTQTHPLRNFLASWKTLGNMAITGQANPEPDPPEEEQHWAYLPALFSTHQPDKQPAAVKEVDHYYIVQRGDFLVGLARRFSINWRKLASLNHLEPPFTIFPGQKLKIP
jgi:nucleoid-associated protein YgaU